MKKSILVIDDDPSILELLRLNLSSAGYQVACASNGKQALAILETGIPDGVVLDVMMPEMDGWELLKAVRDHPDLSSTKVLMLTAKGSARDRMIGTVVLKADEYMTKPFEIGNLLTVLKGLL